MLYIVALLLLAAVSAVAWSTTPAQTRQDRTYARNASRERRTRRREPLPQPPAAPDPAIVAVLEFRTAGWRPPGSPAIGSVRPAGVQAREGEPPGA